MEEKGIGKNSPWLQIIKDIYRIHRTELEKIKDEEKRYDRLVELNVIEQTENVREMDFIQSIKGTPEYPAIHSWVFDMRSGKIIELNAETEEAGKKGNKNSWFSKVVSVFKKK